MIRSPALTDAGAREVRVSALSWVLRGLSMSAQLTVKSAIHWILLALALVLAGILVAGATILVGEYSTTHWIPSARWVGLALFTALVFGIVITEYSRSWRSPRFWAVITGLVASHVLAYAVLFSLAPEWPPIWFAFITMVEEPVLNAILFSAGFPIAPLRLRRRFRQKLILSLKDFAGRRAGIIAMGVTALLLVVIHRSLGERATLVTAVVVAIVAGVAEAWYSSRRQ